MSVDLPLNLVSKLLLAARTPEPGDPTPSNDKAWVHAASVSSWNMGWRNLAAGGYVELQELPDPAEPGEDLLVENYAVRLTDLGLEYALGANVSDGARKVEAISLAEQSSRRNADREGWGQF